MKFELLTATALVGLSMASKKPRIYTVTPECRSTLNPAYAKWQNENGEQGTSLNPQQARNALVVVSTQDDIEDQNQAMKDAGREEYAMAQSTIDAVYGDMQNDDLCRASWS
jgi:hypothetical protein